MIYRGEDKALKITIADSAGVLQSIDAMSDLIAALYSTRFKQVMIKFRKVETSGYTTLLRVSATEYTAIIPHSITEMCPISTLNLEVELFETDERFDGSLRRTKGVGVITEVKASVLDE
jgi:hypothetical protein